MVISFDFLKRIKIISIYIF